MESKNLVIVIPAYEPNKLMLDLLVKLNEFFNLKNTTELSPSLEDMKLILFSKDKKSTLISNDWDITFFSEELIHKNLAHKIINFKDLSFTN